MCEYQVQLSTMALLWYITSKFIIDLPALKGSLSSEVHVPSKEINHKVLSDAASGTSAHGM